MITLQSYREYWEDMPRRIPEIKSVMAITIDDEIGKRLQNLRPEQLPALFYLPPNAQCSGDSVDSARDVMDCLVLVMARFDTLKGDAWTALEVVQPIIEKVKQTLMRDALPCMALNVQADSITTAAETGFYRGLAGWSIGFNAI